MPQNKILFCTTCTGQDAQANTTTFGESVRQALKDNELHTQFAVDYVACMGACEEPLAIALQGKDKASLMFAGLDETKDVGDVIATCKTYLEAEDGWIENALPCGRLRHCLKARIPALKS